MKNETILGISLLLAAGVGGAIYVQRKGGIDKVFGNSGANLMPTGTNTSAGTSTTKPNYSSYSSASANYTTPTATRTRNIQTLLVQGGYLPSPKEIDGKWGAKTDAAFAKATAEKRLKPITNEASYENWIRGFNGGGSSGSSSGGSTVSGLLDIARFINQEFRSMTTNYGAIRDRLKPLTASQIKEVDRLYRDFSPNGLAKDFRNDDAGGKVTYESFNVKAIRDMLADAGLRGIAQIEVLAGIP